MSQPPADPLVGTTIAHYEILAKIGGGGMGIVYRAKQLSLQRDVAVKMILRGALATPAELLRFRTEAEAAARLDHPGIVPVYDVGEFDGHPLYSMKLVDGETLVQRLARGPMQPREAADILRQVARAMHYAHQHGVLHRDLKPSNILLDRDGVPHVTDFGLAKQLDTGAGQTRSGVALGTPCYMAPEQVMGLRSDPRSDLFALGSLMYFFATGTRPFGDPQKLKGLKKRLWRDPYPPRALRPDYPLWLQEIVLRCLEIEPAWRYPTATQLAFDLSHPDQVKLTKRAERLKRDPLTTVLRRRFNDDLKQSIAPAAAAQISTAPIVAVALDVAEGAEELNDALRVTASRILATLPSARLACLNVLKQSRVTIDTTLDEQGHNKQIDRLVALRHWAEPLKLSPERLTVHALEAVDPAAAIVEFAEANRVDHLLIGARQHSLMRHLLGSVSAKVAAEAECSVTVVRPSRTTESGGSQ